MDQNIDRIGQSENVTCSVKLPHLWNQNVKKVSKKAPEVPTFVALNNTHVIGQTQGLFGYETFTTPYLTRGDFM